jgi:hypothetical protein
MAATRRPSPGQFKKGKPNPHAFKKGQSGNPSGRPKDQTQVINFARAHSIEAMERLVTIMRGKVSKLSLRAAEIILDRAYGRVAQAITGEGGEGPVKIEFTWKQSDLAVVDITPQEPELLEAVTVEEEEADGNESPDDVLP